jgi:hypothetical protein
MMRCYRLTFAALFFAAAFPERVGLAQPRRRRAVGVLGNTRTTRAFNIAMGIAIAASILPLLPDADIFRAREEGSARQASPGEPTPRYYRSARACAPSPGALLGI